ncbi:MAG: chemotaxis protein CheW [Myxococcota bacterium]
MELTELNTLLAMVDPDEVGELASIATQLETHADEAAGDPKGPGRSMLLRSAAERIQSVADGSATDPAAVLEAARKLVSAATTARSGSAPAPVPPKSPDAESLEPVVAEEAPAPTPSEAGPVADAPAAPELPAASEPPPYDGPTELVIVDEDAELLDEFMAEALDNLSEAERALLELEADPTDRQALDTVFRAFHTIKGGASMIDLAAMAEIAHRAESLLDRMRQGKAICTGDNAELVLRAVDVLGSLANRIRELGPNQREPLAENYIRLFSDLGRKPAKSTAPASAATASTSEATSPPADEPAPSEPSAKDPATVQDDPSPPAAAPAEATTPPSTAEAEPEPVHPATPPPAPSEAVPVAAPAEAALPAPPSTNDAPPSTPTVPDPTPQTPTAPTSPKQAVAAKAPPKAPAAKGKESAKRTAKSDSWIRLRSEHLDYLIDMVGELVIANSMLREDVSSIPDNRGLRTKVSQMSKIVRELQDLSMGFRMVPFKSTFQRLQRVVRDAASRCGKQVKFQTEGDDTEIDRNMVEVLSDPLIHMIRNAVDHGVETPDVRKANGKSPTGEVTVRAYHSQGNVVVQLQDDGAGLHKEKILNKAIKNGVVTSERAASMTDSEIYSLIFEAGLSTAEKLSAVSGRGVGMDVVRTGVQSVGGRIDIKSQVGAGSTFTITLPLTLAITDAMVIRVGPERYLIPTVDIETSIRPTANMLTTVAGKGELLIQRNRPLPLLRLHDLFSIPQAKTEPTEALVVVLQHADKRCGVLVDELLGQQQVVVKSLGERVGQVPGVSGGAILADGRVGLILDSGEIFSLGQGRHPSIPTPEARAA